MPESDSILNHSGSKYVRKIYSCVNKGESIQVDVYAVLKAYKVDCQATAHAIKKLLCAGLRGKASPTQDLTEAIDALKRAVEQSQEETP